ncbi:MAG: EAL domain-containing protein [Pseudomonadota bacterium]|nr:EAL domain-containing protein [Pseudomonadota bacterium]
MVSTPTAHPEAAAIPARSFVVLVVTRSESVAKNIESYLRNAGHPIRCAWVTDLEDVEEALRSATADLLIVSDEQPVAAATADVVGVGRRLMPELPILVLTKHVSSEEQVAALAAGARDLISNEDLRHMRHLELVVLREIGTHTSFRELRSTRQRLAAFEDRHQQLITSTNDAVAYIQEGILSQANPAFAQLLGYPDPEELNSLPLMDLVAEDHQTKVKAQLKMLQRGKSDGKPLECCLMHKEGRRVAISAQMMPSTVDGEQLIEMLIKAEAPAAAAPTAGGTVVVSTAGRLEFFAALAAAIASADPKAAQRAAVLFTVDDYAGAETRIGLHDAAQAVEQLQEWLKTQLQPQDQLFRFSTHEIAALVSRKSVVELAENGEAIVAEVGGHIFSTTGHEAHVSLTVAAYPLSGSEDANAVTADLVRDARELSAKGGKKFANVGPTAASSQQEREDARKATMIKSALENQRLKLAFQSIASLEGDTRQHFDVLVRVIDDSGNEVHASEFIGAAEKHGLMTSIDRWVIDRALKVQAKREGAQQASSLFVKISEDSLKDAEQLIEWTKQQVKTRALKPGEIVFELRELVVQNHVRKARMLTKALSDLGAQIAIEHFGIGANPAQMIEHIPMQFIKFHHSYTAKFNDKEMHRKLVSLMETAKAKGIKIIVTHVEDANVMARLWQLGVNFIQGYHVQEPEVVLLSADVKG